MLKKIIQILLIILSIFIGGVFIAIVFYPETDIPGQQASNMGGGVVYATLVVLFIWAVYGSYKKWSKKKENLVEAVGTTKRRTLKILIITTVIFIALVTPILYQIYFSDGTATTRTTNNSGGWTDETKASFKQGMLNSCGSKATELCECTANYLIERYSLEELSKLQNWTPEEGKPPQEILDATEACFSSSQ